jgi:glycosyltransferase involved in cell wall biosynthesis
LHLIINSSDGRIFTGSSIQLEKLNELKQKGFKICLTAIEYKKTPISENQAMVNLFNQYFDIADKVIFVDEEDKECAIGKVSSTKHSIRDKITSSKVIKIPNTVDLDQILPFEDRTESNILTFGMIRPYKGFEYSLKIAEELKKQNSNIKVIIVGSTHENYVYELGEILIKSYQGVILSEGGEASKKINDILSSKETDNFEKKQSLLKIHDECKGKESINVELYFDIEETELASIFSRCKYSANFYPGKGLSNHFSGVSNAIIMGMKVYGFVGDITPDFFKDSGQYTDLAMTFRERDLEVVAKNVIEDIKKIESNTELQRQLKQKIKVFIEEEEIGIDNVARKHQEVYDSLTTENIKSNINPLLLSSEPVTATIENTLQKLTGIDVADLEKHEKLFVYHLFLESREEIRKSTKSDEEKTEQLTEYFNNKIDTFYEYLDDEKLKKLKINEQILKNNFTTINDGLNSTRENPYQGKDQWYRIYGHDDVFVNQLWKIDNRLDLEMRFALNIRKENENGHLEEFHDDINPFKPGFLFGTIVASTPGLIMTALRMGVYSTKVVTKNIVTILDCKKIDKSKSEIERH